MATFKINSSKYNSVADIANKLNENQDAIYKANNRVKKGYKDFKTKSLLLYRLLYNCELGDLDFFLNNDNFENHFFLKDEFLQKNSKAKSIIRIRLKKGVNFGEAD